MEGYVAMYILHDPHLTSLLGSAFGGVKGRSELPGIVDKVSFVHHPYSIIYPMNEYLHRMLRLIANLFI